jgi:hypothetical protein
MHPPTATENEHKKPAGNWKPSTALEELSSMQGTRGYDRAEKATAVRDEREMHRASLTRKVCASASSSATEAEFVRRRPRHRTAGTPRDMPRTPLTSSLGTPYRNAPSKGSARSGSAEACSPPI